MIKECGLRSETKGKNKEKCVNRAIVPDSLLEHGVQKAMDPEEPKGPVDPSAPPLAIETMLGYTGAVGTTLWYELSRDRGKVRSRP